jgi:hypothetical protein
MNSDLLSQVIVVEQPSQWFWAVENHAHGRCHGSGRSGHSRQTPMSQGFLVFVKSLFAQ